MIPKKETLEKAKANGSIDHMVRLMSAVQILNSEANNLIEEASDLMQENGLMIGQIKKLHSDFVRSSDRYFKEFSLFVTSESSKMDMFEDLEHFDKSFREWAKLSTDWGPKEVEQ